ncbi:glycosyltransferase [Epilithonimonas hominis]|uniref:Rhamnosyl/mannosyltransferase n=1 Tax=Epilithonimonas hominis TaxID=420404 RepID=A0A1H6KU00_9FLAO|nr:glycosyltransferase [Epilithonimonas hominis]SEH76411.1 rhamnosyl/mannosyltransferase [Epilithonimonas hominis]
MKVLQLGKFFPIRGGVEKVMYDLLIGLSQRSITCDMLCASSEILSTNNQITPNKFSEIFVEPSINEIAKTKISPALISKLRKICSNYDIIHLHHPDPMSALALFLSGYRGKVILHWHSDILAQKVLLRFYKPLQTWILKRADLILTTSPNYLEQSKYLTKYKKKSDILPIGISDISKDYNVGKSEHIKQQYKDKKIIFSLGRLVTYKGFEYLINAAEYLPEDYVILIGGEGPLKQHLQDIINQKQLNSKVCLLGYLDDVDVFSYYKACDLYCLSSIEKTEAFAIVQIEAMSFSKPIVATEIFGSGVSWVNKNGYSGINVPPKNSQKLSLAIIEILQNKDRYDKYCNNARQRYLEFFNIKSMIDNVLVLYNSIFDK